MKFLDLVKCSTLLPLDLDLIIFYTRRDLIFSRKVCVSFSLLALSDQLQEPVTMAGIRNLQVLAREK